MLTKRLAVQCPLCVKSIINLNRHLQLVHHLKQTERNKVKFKNAKKGIYNLQKKNCFRQCMYISCGGKFYKRLDRHLIRKHNHVSGSRLHLNALKKSKLITNLLSHSKQTSTILTKNTSLDINVTIDNYDNKGNITELKNKEDKDYSVDLMNKLNEFQEWLISPDGGGKLYNVAIENVKRVRDILKTTKINCPEMKEKLNFPLYYFTSNNIKQFWFQMTPNLAAATKRTRLFSLLNFIRFLKEDYFNCKIDKHWNDKLDFLIQRCYIWSKSLRRQISLRHNDKLMSDAEKMITQNQVTNYSASMYVKRVLSLLTESQCFTKLICRTYNDVRNYLLLEIQFYNCQRSGVLSNLKLKEFNNTKIIEINNEKSYVTQIMIHKTAEFHGPANLYLDETLFQKLKLFRDNFRTKISGYNARLHEKDNSFFFLNFTDGNEMSSSAIDKSIKQAWKSGGNNGFISSTLLRKTMITNFHKTQPDYMKTQLAMHMQHLPTTASKYYKFFAKLDQSTSMGKLIKHTFYIE